ncbi:cation chloride cotransporter-like protein [Cucurbitaria berberidis CBS 394.84]|uniref:Cation chloride cotransporter-like protein n=1 Tax=Cucurbitaria berberidis CBS 394.84 TaxID=1168544 RepID=A0A9P4GIA0_9PLEO|nr:cation chloride cotransporter-like protein [Cucurbitaria berberidis CBS 394.84]KAF1845681.1 cation chloride cotransporter-like protein [Cucurbitaria berberidis CBS 394.84]
MSDADNAQQTMGRMPPRTRSNFATRTARDDTERLHRRSFVQQSPPANEETPLLPDSGQQESSQNGLGYDGAEEQIQVVESLMHWFSSKFDSFRSNPPKSITEASKPRPGAFPRPVGGTEKLGTFAGVFVPVTLNVLSILMFLRFGFILGQAGLVGMMGMLVAAYLINLLTTMSISAIATNGTVRGGGAYYLISRSLGPEFGGSIGIVFYLGSVFNTSLNAVGLIDCFIVNFGTHAGNMAQWLPQSYWWQFLWATAVLAVCTLICLAGSRLFARCSNGLLIILLVAIISIPLSAAIKDPFVNMKEHIVFTGFSLDTFRQNLLPNFTRGAAGSVGKHRESFQDLFGILFPATGGILAGASMSGDLKHPSKAIPKGTLYGLGLTFILYTLVIFAMAATIGRESFYSNTNVIQLTNISGVVILAGEFATSLFSVLMGVIGSAKLLQALSRDHLIPGISLFGQGTRMSDEPIYAIIITYLIAQITMLADINQIASFITMTYLMTFLVTNLACFLLKIGSAPNFRPSFHFFNSQTAAVGTIVCGVTMFFVDGFYASGCVALLLVIFLLIHYTTPPKPWGDVSQGLIYHQVRKYLLRLRQEHVKFWRPQILLLVNDPRRQYKLIQFCNSLKKGGLFVLGHVIVTKDFGSAVPEARQQQRSWTKYIDFSRIKAFVNIAISPTVEWGARNLVLGAGLGGMRPNIVVMGFYNLSELRQNQPSIDIPSPQPSRPSSKAANRPVARKAIQAAPKRRQTGNMQGTLPTDAMRPETAIDIRNYVTVIEDLVIRLQANFAIGKGFQELEVPSAKPTAKQKALSVLGLGNIDIDDTKKKFIDLWPIQMSAEVATTGEEPSRNNVLTTNFDTYTLILQLGCILHTVPSWKRSYKLRVCVFVEYEADVEEERGRVTTLLRNLRIEAEVLVFWLASGDLGMYEVILNGHDEGSFDQIARDIDYSLEDERWWQDIKRLRRPEDLSASQEIAQTVDILEAVTSWPIASFQHGRHETRPKRFAALQRMLRRAKNRTSLGDVQEAGAKIGMRSQRLPIELLADSGSDSASSTRSDDGKDDDEADDEAIASESEAAVSGSNFDEYDLDASTDESDSNSSARRPMPSRRTQTTPSPSFFSKKLDLRKVIWKGSPKDGSLKDDRPTSDSVTPLKPHPGAVASDTAVRRAGRGKKSSSSASSTSQLSPSSRARTVIPPLVGPQSLPKFTSNPTPRTVVASEEAAGPSIMFVNTPKATGAEEKKDPIATAPVSPAQLAATAASSPQISATNSPLSSATALPTSQATTSPASGYPAQQSIPLSFNDLPCRAQHLILNELIRRQSDDTAVVFTTLPSPIEGTCESEAESVKYISDLEVLCQGLPPVLLVHSNSMTVTMNL